MFKYRVLSTIIIMPIIIISLFILNPVILSSLAFFTCTICSWEWSKFAGLTTCYQKLIWSTFFVLILIIFNFFIYTNINVILQMFYILSISLIWWFISLFLVLSYPYSAKLWRNSIILHMLFEMLTIIPFYTSILVLTRYYNNPTNIGSLWILYIFMLVWSVDSGSYIFGRIFGCHKLATLISPSKTWEGLIGGLLTSWIIGWLFYKYLPIILNPYILFVCSSISVLFAILGDLVESMFKREAGIKNSGYCIPGHGGILDRIDSLTSAVPIFVYLILFIFNAV